MTQRASFGSGLFLLLSLVATATQGLAVAAPAEHASGVKDGPVSTAPVSADGFVVLELGRVGDIFRAGSGDDPRPPQWFIALPTAEQQRIVGDLNAWSVRVTDVVKPKSISAKDPVTAWRFASKADPVSEIVADPASADVGQMTVRTVISLVHVRPAGVSDEKEFFLEILWTPAKGHEVRIRPWLKFTKFALTFHGVLPAALKPPQTAPTTRLAH
jgi:hypothetical protein